MDNYFVFTLGIIFGASLMYCYHFFVLNIYNKRLEVIRKLTDGIARSEHFDD